MEQGAPPELAAFSLRTAPPQAVAQLQEEGLSPLAARIFAARGVCQREEISPSLKSLPPPAQLPGVEAMAAALAQVCASGEALCIIGDYDADGVTSTTLAYDCLRRLGANVHWFIPNRYTNGYGLTPEIVEAQAAAGMRHLLTVDNGTTAHAAIARARELGITVYVVDHHQPDDTPNAAAHLVNPQVANGDGQCFRGMVGVGLAFYLMAQLRSTMNADILMSEYLDLVALGTIADCGEMDRINRALTAGGLARMRAGKSRPGMAALAAGSNVGLSKLNSRSVGFRLAPRINAAGRIGSADAAMHCLLAQDTTSARTYAAELEALNNKRLGQQQEVYDMAMLVADGTRSGIVIGSEKWPSGIVGIIAGKVAERFCRPAVVMHREPSGDWRGSGRTAGGVDLVAVLRAVDAAHPGMLLNYGGHRQAAGVQVKGDCLSAFADAFDIACAEEGSDAPPAPPQVDALSTDGLTREAMQQFEYVPWGTGFTPPDFAGVFQVLQKTPIRGGNLRLRLADAVSGAVYGAILFGRSDLPHDRLAAVYNANISPYDGEVQLIIQSVLTAEGGGA